MLYNSTIVKERAVFEKRSNFDGFMSEEKKKVLLIGAENKLVTKSAQWGSDFYVGDYDIVIVDTTTLTKEKIAAILKEEEYYFKNLRDKIFEAQHSSRIRVITILSNLAGVSSPSDTEKFIDTSNYAWCPTVPLIGKTKSNEMEFSEQEKAFIVGYLRKIRGFYPLEFYEENIPRHLAESKKFSVSVTFNKIATNKVNKAAAFSLGWKIFEKNNGYVGSYPITQSNVPILFLPALPDKDAGIDMLVREFISEDWQPEWIDGMMMPGEDTVFDKIGSLDKEKSKIEEKIEIEKANLQTFFEYKKLLFGNGRDFEATVGNALKGLGAEVLEPEDKLKEDRYFEVEDGIQIPVEIRGRDSREMSEEDLSQLIKRLIDRPSSTVYKTRGIFIFNHFRKTEPIKRSEAFGVNIIKQAQAYNICLITGCDIYDAVCRLLAGEDISDFRERLLNTVGKFQAEDVEE